MCEDVAAELGDVLLLLPEDGLEVLLLGELKKERGWDKGRKGKEGERMKQRQDRAKWKARQGKSSQGRAGHGRRQE